MIIFAWGKGRRGAGGGIGQIFVDIFEGVTSKLDYFWGLEKNWVGLYISYLLAHVSSILR